MTKLVATPGEVGAVSAASGRAAPARGARATPRVTLDAIATPRITANAIATPRVTANAIVSSGTVPCTAVMTRATRRDVLRAAVSAAALAMSAPLAAANAALAPTPANALGPFYPPRKPADSDADLTQVAGQPAHAQGTLLYVTGRILDRRGEPLPNATIEVWQANAFGRYHHPADGDRSGALDPGFQGYGRLVTDVDGVYRLKTIKPPPYSGRTPHIHFIVASADVRLTTQMFFENEARNERDFLYRNLDAAARRASTARFVDRSGAMEPQAIAATWDVVLTA